MDPRPSLLRLRLASGFSQEDVATALGVSRAMVSYWESSRRDPSAEQLAELERLFGSQPEKTNPIEAVLLRSMQQDMQPEAKSGVQSFVRLLDAYADLADRIEHPLEVCVQSPFVPPRLPMAPDEIRRKAEEVRAHLRLGVGPITDIDAICELLRINLFYEPLGSDLRRTISGAFLRHPRLGLSVLVNLEMTPGRRRFTIAHELAHALFHSREEAYILSMPGGPREKWADAFAGEFLMPVEGIRRLMDEAGLDAVGDPVDVVHLQRFFRVSYATALVRLRAASLLTADQFNSFRGVQPVKLAQAMGYTVDDDEHDQSAERWGLAKFPAAFRRLLRQALQEKQISISEAATLTNVEPKDFRRLLASAPTGSSNDKELDEYDASGTLRA